ncbi:PREDICTED: caspase-8-like [Eufriesea mexicana]|uniref:caspase-8-like n=1 Tax=Eufriesea mexicana TaxID=516756 RepID=UPI00083BCDC1|nr:PREDICTED: caspase-8-like [Eufriesea mexicana]
MEHKSVETMSLSVDAKPYFNIKSNVTTNILNKDILWKIEDDLDIDEKISILFLMTTDYEHGFKEIYDLLQKHKECKVYILTEFINKYSENWKNKLVEAICVIQNKQILRKLGISFEYINVLYLPKYRLCSRYLNLTAKCLYILCEALTIDRIKLLLQYVRADLTKYDENLKDTDYLELHMLYWMQENYISICLDGKVKLKNLLKHLKRFDDLELIYEDLETNEKHQNVLDTQHMNSNTAQLQMFSMRETSDVEEKLLTEKEKDIKNIDKGLCIIISQMHFVGQNYETRFGTAADCMKLSETFKGIGFTIKEYNDLKKDEILRMLENIPKEFGIDYDCIFVCILSHGCKGGIISADAEEVSIDEIEYKFCSAELENVIKIVIIQACQGEVIGQVNDALTTDGSTNYNSSDISIYRNFCIFMSTMQGFVSVRHKKDGSWFIQEFCSILQTEEERVTFLQVVRKTMKSLLKKKGKLNGIQSIEPE